MLLRETTSAMTPMQRRRRLKTTDGSFVGSSTAWVLELGLEFGDEFGFLWFCENDIARICDARAMTMTEVSRVNTNHPNLELARGSVSNCCLNPVAFLLVVTGKRPGRLHSTAATVRETKRLREQTETTTIAKMRLQS